MITLERVEELRVAVDLSHHSDIALLNDERLDLLSILNEYADKLRAGGKPTAPQGETPVASVLSKTATHGGPITPSADASPGSISREDEAAGWIVQTTLNDWVEFLKLPGMDKELEAYVWDEIDERILALIRARLQQPSPAANKAVCVTREWVARLYYALCPDVGSEEHLTTMLAEIGVRMEDK